MFCFDEIHITCYSLFAQFKDRSKVSQKKKKKDYSLFVQFKEWSKRF